MANKARAYQSASSSELAEGSQKRTPALVFGSGFVSNDNEYKSAEFRAMVLHEALLKGGEVFIPEPEKIPYVLSELQRMRGRTRLRRIINKHGISIAAILAPVALLTLTVMEPGTLDSVPWLMGMAAVLTAISPWVIMMSRGRTRRKVYNLLKKHALHLQDSKKRDLPLERDLYRASFLDQPTQEELHRLVSLMDNYHNLNKRYLLKQIVESAGGEFANSENLCDNKDDSSRALEAYMDALEKKYASESTNGN